MSSIRNGWDLRFAFLIFLNSLQCHRGLRMGWCYFCCDSLLVWAIMILLYKKEDQTDTHPPKSVPKAGHAQNSAVHDLIIVLISTN